MKILCVYGMENARIAFEALKSFAESEGHVVKVVGSLKPSTDDDIALIGTEIDDADKVVVGMASSAELARGEIFAGETARAKGVPYGFFIDVRGVATQGRDWFSSDLRRESSFVLLTEDEPLAPIEDMFLMARIARVGHPKYEENGAIRISPVKVLEKLAPFGVSRWKTRVFIPGSKTPAVNVSVLKLLPRFGEVLADVQFIMGVHPGHPKDEASMSAYKEFEDRVIFLTKEATGIGAVDMIPAVSIYANIASTDIGRAATLRRACMQFETPELVAMVVKNSGVDGFPPHDVKTGVATLVKSTEDIQEFLRTGPAEEQYEAQEREYRAPPVLGTAVKEMLSVLIR